MLVSDAVEDQRDCSAGVAAPDLAQVRADSHHIDILCEPDADEALVVTVDWLDYVVSLPARRDLDEDPRVAPNDAEERSKQKVRCVDGEYPAGFGSGFC